MFTLSLWLDCVNDFERLSRIVRHRNAVMLALRYSVANTHCNRLSFIQGG